MSLNFALSFTNWEGGDDAGEGGGLQFLLLVSGGVGGSQGKALPKPKTHPG